MLVDGCRVAVDPSTLHGTCATHPTEPTCDHGAFGAALVTKKATLQAIAEEGRREVSERLRSRRLRSRRGRG